MLEVYTNIKKRRLELGMSQETLAQKVGYYDRSAISKIERGQTDVPLPMLEKIAAALRTDPAELIGNIECCSAIESDMFYYFRQLNDEGQEMVVSMLKGLVVSEQYKKHNSDSMVEEEA